MVLYTGASDASWEAYGRTDPYFGVLSRDAFRGKELGDEARAEFFATGERHVEAIMGDIRRFAPDFEPTRALDFGCGVGRLLIPLARRCESAVGVDVSPSMLDLAAANCRREGVRNVELVPSDDRLSRVAGTFDLLHSFIVFQHMPVRRGEAILRRMLDLLADGGVGALHFTFADGVDARDAVHWVQKNVPLAHNLANIVRGRPFGTPMMQVNNYRVDRLLAIVNDGGCPLVQGRATDHGGRRGIILYFRKEGALSL